jgi:hypothetical protein
MTNGTAVGSVDWASLNLDDPSLRISELPLSTEVKIESTGFHPERHGGGLVLHFRRVGDHKLYDLYTIDVHGALRLQRRTPDDLRLLYQAPASPFNVGGYNTLGVRSAPDGYELYVNDVLQELISPEDGEAPAGGSAGPAAIGIGRFCFENFIVYQSPRGRPR